MSLRRGLEDYWRRTLVVTVALLFIWFLVTFVVGYFARALDGNFFGWPLAFYLGAQGSLVVYLGIIWFYDRYMDRLDREYGVHEDDES
ncbi:MAG: DUF4212 domain-containing protein [Quisquiliibacterium sp.]|jgi:putative solute:sodium symporter small subunit